MGRSRYKIYEEEYPYFMTSSVVNEYPLFSIPEAARIILNGFCFLQDEREVALHAYVIMENHIHFIASGKNLAKKVRLFKSYTAREIVDLLKLQGRNRVLRNFRLGKRKNHKKSDFQVWQEGYHPKQVVGDDMMTQKIKYTHQNPVKRGYVDLPKDWRYSSARNYMGEEGLISVTLYQR